MPINVSTDGDIRIVSSDLISSSCCLTDDWTDTERRSTVTDVTSDHCYRSLTGTHTHTHTKKKENDGAYDSFPKLAVANQEGKEAVPPAVAWEEFSVVL